MSSELEKQPEDLAIWRFGVISPLLHRDVEGIPLRLALERLAKRTFTLPDGRQQTFSPDTLRHWLYLFRKFGLDGLYIKVRKDKGKTSLPEPLQDAIVKMREENPAWTVKRIMVNLKKQGLWNGIKPGFTSIYRFTSSHNLNRNPEKAKEPVYSFEFPNFGDLWIADFLHGPKVRVGGREKKAYLHVIIDDATRYIVAATFYLAEDTKALISDLMLAARRFGLPLRFYTDNGSAFRSKHLLRVLARLGISLHHTPAYRPQGRGKVERIFRSIRDGLITGRARTSLESLNKDIGIWVSDYHRRIHTSLGMSPLDKRLKSCDSTKKLDGVRNIDALFRMEENKNIYSDGCIRIGGRLYDVPEALPGQKVKVAYLPWDLSVVFIGDDMVPVKPLDKIKNAMRYNKPTRKRREKS